MPDTPEPGFKQGSSPASTTFPRDWRAVRRDRSISHSNTSPRTRGQSHRNAPSQSVPASVHPAPDAEPKYRFQQRANTQHHRNRHVGALGAKNRQPQKRHSETQPDACGEPLGSGIDQSGSKPGPSQKQRRKPAQRTPPRPRERSSPKIQDQEEQDQSRHGLGRKQCHQRKQNHESRRYASTIFIDLVSG